MVNIPLFAGFHIHVRWLPGFLNHQHYQPKQCLKIMREFNSLKISHRFPLFDPQKKNVRSYFMIPVEVEVVFKSVPPPPSKWRGKNKTWRRNKNPHRKASEGLPDDLQPQIIRWGSVKNGYLNPPVGSEI